MKAEFEIGFELETDGGWIAEVSDLPGVLAYGSTREEAKSKVVALADKVVQEKAPDERSSHGSQ
jgi:predicted RNase H-like HicB family nuclease